MKKFISTLLILVSMIGYGTVAQARDNHNWVGPVVALTLLASMANQPTYAQPVRTYTTYAPAPTYYAPQPAYNYPPPPVYYQEPVVVYSPPPVFVPSYNYGYGYSGHHNHHNHHNNGNNHRRW